MKTNSKEISGLGSYASILNSGFMFSILTTEFWIYVFRSGFKQ